MHQPPGEHKDLPLVDGLGAEGVGRGDKPHGQFAFEDEHNLGGTRVSVGWVEAAGCVVDACHGDAERIEAGDLLDVGGCDLGSHGVVGCSWVFQPSKEEIRSILFASLFADKPINLYACKNKTINPSISL